MDYQGDKGIEVRSPIQEFKMKTIKVLAAVAVLALTAAPAFAANFEVQMLNKGADGVMLFEPALTQIAPGDTVTFIPTDKGHNAETIKDMLPEGAEAFKGAMGKEVVVTFITHGRCQIDAKVVELLKSKATLCGVFVTTGTEVQLDYLDQLASHYVIAPDILADKSSRKAEALKILSERA